MFLSKPGECTPCGMFTIKHLIIFVITILIVLVAVINTNVKEKENIKRIIRNITIIIWVLEIIKTIYNIAIGKGNEINKIVPLYYCSLFLFSCLMSSVGKGFIKRMGDVFLATGGIIGGVIFLILPTTSLPEYPLLHFISLHSFFYHGTMIYLGIIINKSKYIELKFTDLFYYFSMVGIICVAAYFINQKFGSNLMFISRDFPGTILSKWYNDTGKLYTPLCCLVQMTCPFIGCYIIIKIKDLVCKKISKKAEA